MRQVRLAPIIHHDAYTAAVAVPIRAYFEDVLIRPLENAASPREPIHNSKPSALDAAIREGRVEYSDGTFRGKFNAAISMELRSMGARFYGASNVWKVPMEQIPAATRLEINRAQDDSKAAFAAVLATLALIAANAPNAETGISIREPAERVIDSAETDFERSLDDLRDTVGKRRAKVAIPDLPDNLPDIIRPVEDAVKEDAKRVLLEEAERLTRELEQAQNKPGGGTMADLKKTIERAKKRVSNRTDGIAEEATSIIISDLRQEKAKQIGADEYVWVTMRDDRVRPLHRILDGKKFSWDNPPVTNEQGQTNNPGEDINCRCSASFLITIPDEGESTYNPR